MPPAEGRTRTWRRERQQTGVSFELLGQIGMIRAGTLSSTASVLLIAPHAGRKRPFSFLTFYLHQWEEDNVLVLITSAQWNLSDW